MFENVLDGLIVASIIMMFVSFCIFGVMLWSRGKAVEYAIATFFISAMIAIYFIVAKLIYLSI